MTFKLSQAEQKRLTEFSNKFQYARAQDLENHMNSLNEDTYKINTKKFNSFFYWPDGHDGPVTELPYLKHLSPTEEQLIEHFEENSNYTFLAYGVGRVTFTIDTNPNYIIKIGRWGLETIMGNGSLVNQSEKEFYEHTNDILEDTPLLPIEQSADDHSWALQRKVTTYENYTGDDKPDFDTLLTKINERLGPFANLITDKTKNNIGIVDGEWYLFDYGQRI